jgi:membrane fusion protein (multidrug efflux system)
MHTPAELLRPAPFRGWVATSLLFLIVAGAAVGLTAWKRASRTAQSELAASQPEPREAATAVLAEPRRHVRTTTAIGTVLALRSITLENELAGTVREVHLPTGEIVAAGTVLVALDVQVEQAELRAQQAQADLAETLLGRIRRARESHGASDADVDRAQAELDVARANVARTRAVIERKTLRAPFRARIGIADVHPGQYLDQGTRLTTLQGVDDAVHVDFSVVQDVAAGLAVGDEVAVLTADRDEPLSALIVAVDARVDPSTRNAMARARIEGPRRAPAPGSSVRVKVPVGAPHESVVVPVSALRRGPAGEHVFVLEEDGRGELRAQERRVRSGSVLGDEVVIEEGLASGERVAAAGSFKLFAGVLVLLQDEPAGQAVH